MYDATEKPPEYRCQFDLSVMCAMIKGCSDCGIRTRAEAKSKDKVKDCLKGKSGKHKNEHYGKIRICSKCGKILESLKRYGYWTNEDLSYEKN